MNCTRSRGLAMAGTLYPTEDDHATVASSPATRVPAEGMIAAGLPGAGRQMRRSPASIWSTSNWTH